MNKIKFRWVGKNIHFNEIIIQEGITTEDVRNGSVLTFFANYNENCEFISEDLYIGLNDKRGSKLYEGDIIKEIFRDGSGFAIKIIKQKRINSTPYSNEVIGYEIDFTNNNIEKIGNIYQNTDLKEVIVNNI